MQHYPVIPAIPLFMSHNPIANPNPRQYDIILRRLNQNGPFILFSDTNRSRIMRKPTFCIGKNKDADQVRVNLEADQRLFFCYTDSTKFLFFRIRNFKHQACFSVFWSGNFCLIVPFPDHCLLVTFCDCTCWLVPDLVGKKTLGFPTRRLKYVLMLSDIKVTTLLFDNFTYNDKTSKAHMNAKQNLLKVTRAKFT